MLLIDAIAIVESAGKNIPGDHGEALSIFQIHKSAWEDVKKKFSNPRAAIYLDVGERFMDIGKNDLEHRMRARNTATGYMFILEDRLKRAGQPATPENIYACWNLGFEGFRACEFRLKNCPKTTMQRALRVAVLCKSNKDPTPHRD